MRGEDERGTEYRERLRRLCDFLGELDPEPGATLDDEAVDFEKLQRGLGRTPVPEAREAYLCRLEKLGKAPAPILDGEKGECPNHRVHDLAADHEWAYIQVQVRLARECLQEKAFNATRRERAKKARKALSIAIPWLEKQESNQPSTQGLYGLLATACLTLGTPDETPREDSAGDRREKDDRQRHIESALVYARHAVEIAPESIRERLVLLDVLSFLGDPADIRAQAEIALNLDSGPETLRTIGGSYWGRTVALRGRAARRQLLLEATDFFAKALRTLESASLDQRCPIDQMQAHGWAHFWLGRFQSERARYAEAAAHLRTASSLGFKPLEALIELAWTCFLARDLDEADKAFGKALAEAGRQRIGGAKVADAPGEERPIDDLAFEGYLGWAFLRADWDPDQALTYADQADLLLPPIPVRADRKRTPKHASDANGLPAATTKPDKPELRAALSEVRGRISLSKGDLREGIGHCKDALHLSPRSGAYCALGRAYLSQAGIAGATAPVTLQQAREAYRLGRECDLRGRYRRELRELSREIRKAEGKAPLRTTPTASNAPSITATPAGTAASVGNAAPASPTSPPPPGKPKA